MTPATPATTRTSRTGMAPMGTSSSMMPASNGTTAANAQGQNWFGGPIYHGQPDLKATAALVKAGGGADNFDFKKALVSMLGSDTANAEIDKLNKQYGKDEVSKRLDGLTFVVTDALKRATEAGVKLPEAPSDLKGKDLAKRLVKDGTAPDNTFWAGYLFDHTVSHKVHNQVMADADAKTSHEADGNSHKLLNQLMYDAAQKLGDKDVKLAPFH
jgi:hypothetical protein